MIKRKLQQMQYKEKGGQYFICIPKQYAEMIGWCRGDFIKISPDKQKIVLEKE